MLHKICSLVTPPPPAAGPAGDGGTAEGEEGPLEDLQTLADPLLHTLRRPPQLPMCESAAARVAASGDCDPGGVGNSARGCRFLVRVVVGVLDVLGWVEKDRRRFADYITYFSSFHTLFSSAVMSTLIVSDQRHLYHQSPPCLSLNGNHQQTGYQSIDISSFHPWCTFAASDCFPSFLSRSSHGLTITRSACTRSGP